MITAIVWCLWEWFFSRRDNINYKSPLVSAAITMVFALLTDIGIIYRLFIK